MKKCLKISLSILIILFSVSLIPNNSKAETDHLVINEVYYNVATNKGSEKINEWIEVYNPTNETINLKDWTIRDSSKLSPRAIGSDHFLVSNSFAIITRDLSTWPHWSLPEKTIKVELGLIIGDGLNNTGDEVFLNNPLGDLVDKISYGEGHIIPGVDKGHSLERAPKGGDEFVDQPNPTPGIGLPSKTILSLGAVAEQSIEVSWTQNQDLDFEKYLICVSDVDCLLPFASITDQTITTAMIEGLISGTQYKIKVRVVNSGGGFWDSNEEIVLTKTTYSRAIIVNELFPAPHKPFLSPETNDEYIELFNLSDEIVDLSGWQLRDLAGKTFTIVDKKIEAKDYLVFYGEETGIILNNSSEEEIILFWPDGGVCSSSQKYQKADYNMSWSRNIDGSWSFTIRATPWEANIFTTKQDEIINTPVIPIEEAKAKPKNKWVKVEGVVIAVPGLFGKRVMYIQDASGGIKIYFDKALWPFLRIGDRVVIWGKISISGGEYQIKVYSPEDIVIIGRDPPPEPAKKIIVELGDFIGRLLRVSGRVVKISGSTIWIDDGTGELRIYFYPATGIKGLGLKKGDWVIIVGILSKTKMGLRLLPRSKSDIKIYKKMTAAKNEPSVVSQVLGVEKAQAAGADYRNLSEPRLAGSKKELNPLGFLLVLFGFVSLVSLNIFAKIREKYGNHN